MRLGPVEVGELIWYWSEAEAAVGLHSNFSALVNVLQGLVDHHQPYSGVDLRAVAASGRMKRIERALRELDEHDQLVLWIAYGHRSRLDLAAFGPHAALVLLTDAARKSHTASGTHQGLVGWCEALSRRLAKGRGSEADSLTRRAALIEMDRLLSRASAAFLGALRRRRAA